MTLPEREIDAIIGRVRQRLGDAPQHSAQDGRADRWTEVERLPGMLADTVGGDGRIVIRNARAFVSGTVMERATVVIEGRRISSVSSNPSGGPPGATVVDGRGRFLMPGIIDAHAHLSMMEHTERYPHQPKGAEPLRDGLRGHLVGSTLRRAVGMGVTTIRDVGAYGDTVLDVRQAMRYGAFIGPRLLSCARIVSPTAPGGRFFPGMYREADGPDDMRRAVREQIRAGADFLKIMSTGARSVELENPHPSQCTPTEMDAFIDEAHRQGYRAAAHCEGLGGTELAIVAGADTIEHGFYLNQRPDLLDRMAASGSILVPTLSFLHDVAEDGHWTPELIEQGEYNLDQANRTIEAAQRAGVRLALGYDSPESDLAANELLRMVEHGVGAAEALSSATQGSAMALGIDSEVGTIASGKLADLVLVDGDPIRTPSHLTEASRIHLVTRNGLPVAGRMLESSI